MEYIDLTFYKGSGYATIFTIKDSSGNAIDISGYTLTMTFFDKDGTQIKQYADTDTQFARTGVKGEIELLLNAADIDTLVEGTYVLNVTTATMGVAGATGNVFIVRTFASNIEYLIPYLRLKIGDINASTYRYANEWLLSALILAVKALQKYWDYKYIVDENNIVTRNPVSTKFFVASPPIIETADEYTIILMAAVITLEGSLENSAWNTVSWSDAEIRYTNLDAGKTRENNLKRLIDELNSLVVPPTKRLARSTKSSLPGYIDNDYEYISN